MRTMNNFLYLSVSLFVTLVTAGNFDEYYQEAEFAIVELKKLSDSGVYTTLQLVSIEHAHKEEGLFHFNTVMTIRLSCPYFKSGKPIETFNVIVMTHKDDGLKSFAIDEFPEMTPASIEAFTIEKIKRKRAQREIAFRQLELESVHFLDSQ